MNREAAIPVEEVVEELAPKRRFRTYPEHRDSGIEGVHAVPAHWRGKPLKYVATVNADKLADTTDSDYELEYVDIGNVSLIDGVTSTESYRFENAPSRARRRVQPGDTIVSTVRTYLKAVARVNDPPDNLVVSTGFAVLHAGPKLNPAYLYRLVQSDAFVERVVAHSVGVSYPAINASDLVRLPIPIPTLDEQRSIAAFLDRETARIDELIAKKQRLIELLAEKRTALISHAVTKGLNPDAPMKHTGIAWLGEIPAAWTIHQLRRVVRRFVDYRGRTPTKTDSGVPLITAGAVRDGAIDHSRAPEYIAEDDYQDWMCRGWPEKDDVVITTEAPLAEVALIDDVSVALAQRIILFKLDRSRVYPEWMRYYYLSIAGRSELLSRASGSTATGIRADRLRMSLVSVPPLEEQRDIIEHLNPRVAELTAPINSIQSGIATLSEYRSALINAAVTGKIDVRKVKFKRSGLAKRLINAGEYLFAKHDAESALTPICNAIDRVAKDIYGQSGRSTYQQFIHERMELITRVAFNGTAILNLHFAVSPICDGRGGIVRPRETIDGVGLYSFEQIMYHVVRCNLDHECEIDPVLQDGGRGSGSVKMRDDGTLQMSFDDVAHGLLFAVLSEVNLWCELVGTVYEHVIWKGTRLLDLVGQKSRMLEMSRAPAQEAKDR